MIAAGKSDDEIRAYMVERYGDFVLYKPPFNAATAVLWVAPGTADRRRAPRPGLRDAAPPARGREGPAPQLDEKRRREIEALLDSDPTSPESPRPARLPFDLPAA